MINPTINKKAQVTIFVIIGLIIIVALILIFGLLKEKVSPSINVEADPQKYLQDCLKIPLENAENKIIENNFYRNISDNFVLSSGKKVPLLCTTGRFYLPCVNQEPNLINFVKKNIFLEISPEIDRCLEKVKKEMKAKDYSIETQIEGKEIEIETGKLGLYINGKIIFSKAERNYKIENFLLIIDSPLYRLIQTTRDIVNFESTLCEFDSVNWMLNFRDINIKKFVTGDAVKIYTLTDEKTQKEVKFAVKTCALPAGI